jgi:NADH-quinone oxidoreductase subunit N
MIFNLITILPELSLVIATFFMLIIGVFREKMYKNPKPVSRAFSLGIYISFSIFFFAYFYEVWISHKFHGFSFGNMLASDRLSIIGKALIVITSALWLGLKTNSTHAAVLRAGIQHYEYPILTLMAMVGAFLTVSSNDFLVLLLALELQALPIYIMITSRHESQHSSEAGIKYFLFGSIASAFILFGVAFLYGYSGTTTFSSFATLLVFKESVVYENLWLEVGFVFVLIGLLTKMAIFPFHSWSLDVYEGSANVQVAFLATVPKISIVFILVRFLFGPFVEMVPLVQPYFLWFSVLSIVWGAIGALNQQNIRRLLGYASIHNIGFILLPIGLGSFEGLQIGIEYLVVYALSLVALFIGITSLHIEGMNIDRIADLKGLWERYPKIAILLAICLFSFAGIPPMAGFWIKLHVFNELIKAEMLWPAIIIAFASVVAVFYYLVIIRNIFFEKAENKLSKDVIRFDILMILVAALILYPLYQERLLRIIEFSLYTV